MSGLSVGWAFAIGAAVWFAVGWLVARLVARRPALRARLVRAMTFETGWHCALFLAEVTWGGLALGFVVHGQRGIPGPVIAVSSAMLTGVEIARIAGLRIARRRRREVEGRARQILELAKLAEKIALCDHATAASPVREGARILYCFTCGALGVRALAPLPGLEGTPRGATWGRSIYASLLGEQVGIKPDEAWDMAHWRNEGKNN
jgi:hypothetical protein